METLKEGELRYLDNVDGNVAVQEISHNYAKGILFGFHNSWDRYILTEDVMLVNFIKFIIQRASINIFAKFTVIAIGTADNTVKLKNKNSKEEFFSSGENVLCVLDGDCREKKRFNQLDNMLFLPYESIEEELGGYWDRREPNIYYAHLNVQGDKPASRGKSLLKEYKNKRVKTETEVFEFLIENSPEGLDEFQSKLIQFLSK